MQALLNDDARRQEAAAVGIKLKPEVGPVASSVRVSRLAAFALAGSLFAAPALAGEYATFHNIEMLAPAFPDCSRGTLLNAPAAWQPSDGAVVLLTFGPLHNSTRGSLVADLLFEQVAVLERVAMPCDAAPVRHHGIASGMLSALDAMTQAAGVGRVVAVGYGPGSRAVLDVLREPAPGYHGEAGSRYSAAASIGDGAPVFVLGAARTGEQAGGLAPLCRALTAVAAGMGASLQHDAASRVAEACTAATANRASVIAVAR